MWKKLQQSLRWLLSQYWIWWSFFKSRARLLLSRSWATLAIYSVVILLLSATFAILVFTRSGMQTLPFEVSGVMTVTFSILALVSVVIVFVLSFILLFVLSLFPKGRRIFDKTFKFSEFIELGTFKKKVEGELTTITKRLEQIEVTLTNMQTLRNEVAGLRKDLKNRGKNGGDS